jgi:hypothetical protein
MELIFYFTLATNIAHRISTVIDVKNRDWNRVQLTAHIACDKVGTTHVQVVGHDLSFVSH